MPTEAMATPAPAPDPAQADSTTGSTTWADVADTYVEGAMDLFQEGFGIVDTLQEVIGEFGETARDAIAAGADTVQEVADTAGGTAAGVAGEAGDTLQHMSDNAGRFALGFTGAQLGLLVIAGGVAVAVFAPELLAAKALRK
jgi:hypothetical protein